MKIKILNSKSHQILTTRYRIQHFNFLRAIKNANKTDNIIGDVLKDEIIFSFHDAGFSVKQRGKHATFLKHLALCYDITYRRTDKKYLKWSGFSAIRVNVKNLTVNKSNQNKHTKNKSKCNTKEASKCKAENKNLTAFRYKRIDKRINNTFEKSFQNINKQIKDITDAHNIPLKQPQRHLLTQKIINNKSIWFGRKWLLNFFKELEQVYQKGHEITYVIEQFCKNKYYQLKASAFNVRNLIVKNFNFNKPKRYKTSADIRSDDMRKAMKLAGIAWNNKGLLV